MASAEPKPAPDNANRDLVTRFRDDYSSALAEARISAEHTATEGWQGLYGGFQRHQRERRRNLAGWLRTIAEQLEKGGLTDEDEKAAKDTIKDVQALREDAEAFDRQTVSPVRKP